MANSFNILEKIDWNILNTYIDNNLIVASKHPQYDIWILNYSPKVQSKQFWDDYTLSCRGLVIDVNGNILARPFRKFKNIEEYAADEVDLTEKFEVFEKMDGSLIILFYYEEYMEWIVASRGSFFSDQSREAEKILNKQIFKHLNKNCTYLFEVIYPENRIVVDYHDLRDLILLSRIETKTGFELFYEDLKSIYSKYFTVVQRVKANTFGELNALRDANEDNREGFVVRFENGFRIKMKFAEYCRLHAIITNVSNLTVWEHMMNGYDFDELIDRVPDEFYNWLKKTRNILQVNFNEIERISLKEFIKIYHIDEITNRKEFAEEAKKSENRSILFQLYDKCGYDQIIWKRIRPIYSKPFVHGYDYS